jgi:hypothetical protein
MDNKDDDQQLLEFVNELDDLIIKWQDKYPPHNMSGILLSRITLLMTSDPSVGKELLKYVWTQLDELEQSDPGQYL